MLWTIVVGVACLMVGIWLGAVVGDPRTARSDRDRLRRIDDEQRELGIGA